MLKHRSGINNQGQVTEILPSQYLHSLQVGMHYCSTTLTCAQPSVTWARAYNSWSTTLACARPTVTWVQSIQQLVHHPRMCSSHSDVGSEHTTVGPPPSHVLVPQ
jgi:hypothetical protein